MIGEKHGAKARRANKQQRNFRTNGQNRGSSPSVASQTKWMRSGGPARMAARKARHHGCDSPASHLGKNGERVHA